MATLVSPGVSVSVTNDSFYFPTVAPTVPVFFIATREGKVGLDGVTAAPGTLETGIVRTITSLKQSLETYGVPHFRRDVNGNEHHGDARNEYGLLALNQFLGTGSRAYVVRANINLNDEGVETFASLGVPKLVVGSIQISGIGNGTPTSVVVQNNQVRPQVFTVTFSSPTSFAVRGSRSGYLGVGTTTAPFVSTVVGFSLAAGTVPFVTGDTVSFQVAYAAVAGGTNVGNGALVNLVPSTNATTIANGPATVTITAVAAGTAPAQFSVAYTGSPTSSGSAGVTFDDNKVSFTLTSGSIPFALGDSFTFDVAQVTIQDPLGGSDALRRVSIVQALQAEINSNTDIRSEIYEFNLAACPGYWEVADELTALATDVKMEAMVIADTPSYLNSAQIAAWSMTSDRVGNENIAYYYPWCLTSNADGHDVLGAPSGTVLRTIALSDQEGYVWSAPAGTSRGVVTGVSKVGYVSGTRGAPTKFVESNLNGGERDNLYEFQKNINPITFFPGRGILVWGQKTSAPAASALDRVNVVRLAAYLRRVLRKGAMPFVFQPNDQITRDSLKAAVDGVLHDVLTKRGLYDFATQCDIGNNTADRIDRNELWIDIAIKPVKAAEFIYIPIRVVSTGTQL